MHDMLTQPVSRAPTSTASAMRPNPTPKRRRAPVGRIVREDVDVHHRPRGQAVHPRHVA